MVSDGTPRFYLLKHRLPSDESKSLLGRVIKQFQDPLFDYTPTSDQTEGVRAKYLLSPQYDDAAVLTAKASHDDSLSAKIKGLLSVSANSGNGGTTEIMTPRVTTRRLKLEKDYFNDLKEVAEVRTKVLEMCPMNSKTAYLVVGTMSVQTAEFKRTGESHHNGQVKGSIPIGHIAAPAGGGPIVGKLGNAEVGLQRSDQAQWTRTFKSIATGPSGEPDENAEEVFAICCKEITREWYGLGQGIRMKPKQVEYRSGQHFGIDDELEDDEDDEVEISAAKGLQLSDMASYVFSGGQTGITTLEVPELRLSLQI